jgi:plasmid stabilization system protein ParE
MKYKVVLHDLAIEDLVEAYDYAARQAPLTASRWMDRFEAALQTLGNNPQRCGLARENAKSSVELREYLFGKRPYVFRAIFTVDGTAVRVLRVCRAQRRFLTRKQIEEALEPDES